MLTRPGIKFFVLSLLAMLMATAAAASPAQAVDWLVEAEAGVHELITNFNMLPFALEKDLTARLLATIGSINVTILCAEEKMINGFIEGGGKASGTLEYKSCTTKINSTLAVNCKPAEPITASIKTELFEVENELYVLVLPSTGTVFTTLSFSKLCSIGEEMTISGTGVLQDCSVPGLKTFLLRHLIELGPNSTGHVTSLEVSSGGESFNATLDGSAWVKLENDELWKGMFVGVL